MPFLRKIKRERQILQKKIVEVVELLRSYTTTQSHWSNGSTICFLLRGGQPFASRGAPTLTLELGFSVSRVSLHW